MPKMAMTIPHTLGTEEALKRIQGMLEELKREHGDRVTDLREDWKGERGEFSLKAMGFSVSGALEVLAAEVRVSGELPWSAKPFQGRIESLIRERAERLLTDSPHPPTPLSQ